jgi:maleylacetate reductase
VDASEAFTWIDGERLVRYRAGAAAEAPELAHRRGLDGATLLTTTRARAAAPAVVEASGLVLQVPRGPVADVSAGLLSAIPPAPLIALGGGRVIDTAKAIGCAIGQPVAAIPTTLSGAELTRIHRLPRGIGERPRVRPVLVVADPLLMASQPMPGLAASAMNALGHALESLYVPDRNPVATLAALRASRLIADGLDQTEPDRERLALGALLAGYALGSTGLAMHHVVSQTVVALTGAPHAETNAVILPHVVGYVARRRPDALTGFADALGAGRDAHAAAGRVAELARRSGAIRLSQLGVTQDDVPRVAEAVLTRAELGRTPSPPGRSELVALLESAL